MSYAVPRQLLFIYPTGQIRVCKIRFVSTGENRGEACLVRKKKLSPSWRSETWIQETLFTEYATVTEGSPDQGRQND